MKKIIICFSILVVGCISAQDAQKTIVREDIRIPFTCNDTVDQYMADYQTFIKVLEFVKVNGSEDMKAKMSVEYAKFSNKYPNITKEISTLEPEKQKYVAGFIKAKGVELTTLMRK